MIALPIARLIANMILFLDLCDDSVLDPDTAVQQMEEIAADLQAMDKDFLRQLVDAFALIAPEYSGDSQELVRTIPQNFYLEEEIAYDPIRSAELVSKRDEID